jgi:TrpR-related protein YerC/YecD
VLANGHPTVLACYYVTTVTRRGTGREAARRMVDDWKTDDAQALFDAILRLDSRDTAERFFRDLCTLTEIRDMAQRWAIVRLLDEGMHYAQISRQTGASTATITRIASWLNHGEGGYRDALDRLKSKGSSQIPYKVGRES